MSELAGRPDHRSPQAPGERWSLGGAAAIEIAEGVLLPEALIAGPRRATLHARWRPGSGRPDPDFGQLPELGDITAADDQGVAYGLRAEAMSSGGELPRQARWPVALLLGLEPVPGRTVRWLELRGANGTTTRLQPSARVGARVGPLTSAAACPPVSRPGPPAPSPRRDGLRSHLDLGAVLPPIDGVAVRADSLFSCPGHWRLYLRAMPGWWAYADDRSFKWSPVSVTADDDRGGRYLSSFGGSTGRGDHDELVLQFLPGLDPLARSLTLTFRGTRTAVPLTVGLEAVAGSPRRGAGDESGDDFG